MFITRIIVVLLFLTDTIVESDFFTAVSDFEKFLTTELDTIKTLKYLLDSEFKGLINFKSDVASYKKTIDNGLVNGVDNPVQFYLIMKQILLQWKVIMSYNVTSNATTETFDNITKIRQRQRVTVPSEEDLRMSRLALARLQDTYKLNHKDLVVGNIDGITKLDATLDSNDCLQMGIIFLDLHDYEKSVLWMEEALYKVEREIDPIVKREDILKNYAYALYKIGQTSKARKVVSELLKLVDDNSSFYEHLRQYSKNNNYTEEDLSVEPSAGYDDKVTEADNYDASVYKSLCNGELYSNSYANPDLKCYYKRDRPFLRLAPIKVELLNIKPEVYSFKEIITDSEIDILIKASQAKLHRARITGKNGTALASDIRLSKVAWLPHVHPNILPVINKRLEVATNLDLTYSEPLQMSHYGIGGHFDIHWDAARPEISNRIATLLFYMSTPLAGGATVFPLAKVASFPHKNDAILWFNLLKNGKLDRMTLHAGCPVLSGKKWVANKWIHSIGQTFLRKCSRNESE